MSATERIGIWIENDSGLYHGAREAIAYDMSIGDVFQAGSALSEYFESAMDESTVNALAWSILSDLMGSVDWSVIAESVWGDGKEEGDDDEWEEYTYDEIVDMVSIGSY